MTTEERYRRYRQAHEKEFAEARAESEREKVAGRGVRIYAALLWCVSTAFGLALALWWGPWWGVAVVAILSGLFALDVRRDFGEWPWRAWRRRR
jgi:fatty acid desaturase